jgi:alpha-glucosidase
MHQFVKEQPELNWRNPEVKQALFDVLRFWLDRGVDGFRMDVVGHIFKVADFRDNPINENADPNLPENDLFSRLHNVYTSNQPEAHEVYKQFRKLVDSYGEKVIIGELFGDTAFLARCYGLQNDELHMPFNFQLLEADWDAGEMRRLVEEMEAALPDFGWPNYVLGNHDRKRLATRYGGAAQARAAAMMLLTLRGTPTFYYGDELGLFEGNVPPEKIQDPQGVNLGPERSRDHCRTPMQWDASANAGFSPVEPWLPVSADFPTRNVQVQMDDPQSHLNLVKALLALRRSSPALAVGTYETAETAVPPPLLRLRPCI